MSNNSPSLFFPLVWCCIAVVALAIFLIVKDTRNKNRIERGDKKLRTITKVVSSFAIVGILCVVLALSFLYLMFRPEVVESAYIDVPNTNDQIVLERRTYGFHDRETYVYYVDGWKKEKLGEFLSNRYSLQDGCYEVRFQDDKVYIIWPARNSDDQDFEVKYELPID